MKTKIDEKKPFINTKKFYNEVGKMWRRLARFFEKGDLIPFFVIISIAHYIPVLASHDEIYIAALVGMAVDMLHFRAVRAWFNGRILSWGGFFNGVIGVLTTVMASLYHMRFYGNDWLLALPIPVGIAILAYQMSDNDNRLTLIDKLKTERAAALSELETAVSTVDTIRLGRDKLLAELEGERLELVSTRAELDKLKKKIDRNMIGIDNLPPPLVDYIKTVDKGITPNGDFSARWGVGVSSLDRTNSVFKLKD